MKVRENIAGKMLRRFAWLQAVVAGVIMAAITLIVVYGMIMRYLVRKPVGWSIEVPELFFLFVVALGLAYAQFSRSNIRVEFLVERLPAGVRHVLEIIALLFFLGYSGFFIWAGWIYAVNDLQAGSRSMLAKIPLFSVEVLLPLGASFLCLQLILDIVNNIAGLVRRRSDAQGSGTGN